MERLNSAAAEVSESVSRLEAKDLAMQVGLGSEAGGGRQGRGGGAQCQSAASLPA